MGIKIILVLVLGLCSFDNFVKCTRYHMSSTTEQTQHNHPIKSLQYFGDTYDCVEFLKQPAFNNPLLKKHANKYQQMMSSLKSLSSENETYESLGVIGLPDGGCPEGTVPIRRTTSEELTYNNEQKITGISKKAVIQTVDKREYHGASASFSVYEPKVSPNQYSGALMLVGNDVEFMEVGWMVNPRRRLDDTDSRLYVYTHTKSKSCYDTRCDAFVQTNSKIPLGASLKPVTVTGGTVYDQEFNIIRDEASGAWKFQVTKANKEVGFWPGELFADLAESASAVQWGGIVFTVAGESGPPMGSGLMPSGSADMKNHAYADISVVDTANNLQTVFQTISFTGDAKNYGVVDLGEYNIFRHYIEFGGPGQQL